MEEGAGGEGYYPWRRGLGERATSHGGGRWGRGLLATEEGAGGEGY